MRKATEKDYVLSYCGPSEEEFREELRREHKKGFNEGLEHWKGVLRRWQEYYEKEFTGNMFRIKWFFVGFVFNFFFTIFICALCS